MSADAQAQRAAQQRALEGNRARAKGGSRLQVEPAAASATCQVEVWTWPLRVNRAELAALARLLTADEMERASRYVFDHDKLQFVVARARLRQVLARYVDRAPQELKFRHGAHGKPLLGQCQSPPFFNLSHSGNRVAIAVARHGDVGIDIERIRPIERCIAQRYFSRRENAELELLHGKDWLKAFYRYWTRREAQVKASGTTLFSSLAGCRDNDSGDPLWTIADLKLGAGLAGAIATRKDGAGLQVTYWRCK